MMSSMHHSLFIDCAMHRCSRDLVTSYVIHADPSLAMLHGWTQEYQHDALRLMVDTYEGRKPTATWRRPPGCPPTTGLNNVREDAKTILLSTLWNIRDHQGSQSGATVHSDYATRTDYVHRSVKITAKLVSGVDLS